jgi:hypothetical protein
MSLIENGKREAVSPNLSDRARVILASMVYGIEGKLAEKHGLEPGKPLGPQQVADLYNVRRAYVRQLLADPLGKAELMAMLAAKRVSHMPEALHRIATIVSNGEDGVALRASETILGETAKGPGITVNVSQTNVAQIRPGYVIRMPADVASPTDINQS